MKGFGLLLDEIVPGFIGGAHWDYDLCRRITQKSTKNALNEIK